MFFQQVGWGHRVHHCEVALHSPLILSQRVIMAIRGSRPIKAEGVCAGHTCQHFINKMNHRPRCRISPKQRRDERERNLWDASHRLHSKGQQLLKAWALWNLHFPLRGRRWQCGWNIYSLDFCRDGQMLGANGVTAQREDSLKTPWLKRFTADTSD